MQHGWLGITFRASRALSSAPPPQYTDARDWSRGEKSRRYKSCVQSWAVLGILGCSTRASSALKKEIGWSDLARILAKVVVNGDVVKASR
jgi:hypothetical protein